MLALVIVKIVPLVHAKTLALIGFCFNYSFDSCNDCCINSCNDSCISSCKYSCIDYCTDSGLAFGSASSIDSYIDSCILDASIINDDS